MNILGANDLIFIGSNLVESYADECEIRHEENKHTNGNDRGQQHYRAHCFYRAIRFNLLLIVTGLHVVD